MSAKYEHLICRHCHGPVEPSKSEIKLHEEDGIELPDVCRSCFDNMELDFEDDAEINFQMGLR